MRKILNWYYWLRYDRKDAHRDELTFMEKVEALTVAIKKTACLLMNLKRALMKHWQSIV